MIRAPFDRLVRWWHYNAFFDCGARRLVERKCGAEKLWSERPPWAMAWILVEFLQWAETQEEWDAAVLHDEHETMERVAELWLLGEL